MKILRGIRAKDDKFRASCGAFIVDKNRQAVLSFERVGLPNSRQLPQGGVKVYETPLDGIYRELEEETGIKRNELKLIGEYPD
jgi:putative (di)nucleoside polyphosphate hydrolase